MAADKYRVRPFLVTLSIAGALLLSGQAHAQSAMSAKAKMINQKGESVGQVTLEQMPQGVLLKAELTNLPPGWHGFHIHEAASCEPPFDSAGGHFNPGKEKHGYGESGPHPGDLPNIHVASDGKASAAMFNSKIVMRSTDSSSAGLKIYNVLGGKGTAIVIHADPDDYKSDPAGHAGGRIACGIVQGD